MHQWRVRQYMLDNSFVAFKITSINQGVAFIANYYWWRNDFKACISAYTDYIDWREVRANTVVKITRLYEVTGYSSFLLGISLIFLHRYLWLRLRARCLGVLLIFTWDYFICWPAVNTRKHTSRLFFPFFIGCFVPFWKLYHHHSLTSAGFVAITCIIALLLYSIFGTLYIGDEFSPVVKDGTTAFILL